MPEIHHKNKECWRPLFLFDGLLIVHHIGDICKHTSPLHCDWKAHCLRNHRPEDWRRWITSIASISVKTSTQEIHPNQAPMLNSERLKSHFTVQWLWQSSRPPTATRKVTCVTYLNFIVTENRQLVDYMTCFIRWKWSLMSITI